MPPAVVRGDRPCRPELVVNCAEAARDPAVPWIIKGLRLDRGIESTGYNVGLSISPMSRSVLIEDFVVRGFPVGIRIDDEGDSCRSCRIRLSNGSVFTMGAQGTGIKASWGGAPLEIDGVTITLAQGSRMALELLPRMSTRVDLRNLVVQGPIGPEPMARSNGDGIMLRCSGCEGTHLILQNVRIEAVETGVLAWGPHRVEAANLSVERSGGGVRLVSKLPVVATFDGLHLRNNTYGLWTPYHNLALRNAVVQDNAVLGARLEEQWPQGASPPQALIEGSAFRRNGHAPALLPGGPEGSGGLWYVPDHVHPDSPVGRVVQVRESRFEGNHPLAVSYAEPVLYTIAPLDASYNWWNDSAGPRVRVPGYTLLPLGPGDVVDPAVLFAPWKTSP